MCNAWRRVFVCFTVLLLLFTMAGGALALEPFKITEYVTDRAGMLSQDTRAALTRLLEDYADATTNQFLVVTVPSLEGNDLVDFAEKLFELNKPGQKGKDNGLILFIPQKDREVRIEVGYGLEGDIPDGKAGGIIRDYITPAFRAGDFDGGVTTAVKALIQAASPDYLPRGEVPSRPARRKSSGGTFQGILLLIVISILLSIFEGGRSSSRRHRRHRRGFSEPPFWGGGFGGGFGGGSSGGSRGGGFSGGGGSFGGGGASGSW